MRSVALSLFLLLLSSVFAFTQIQHHTTIKPNQLCNGGPSNCIVNLTDGNSAWTALPWIEVYTDFCDPVTTYGYSEGPLQSTGRSWPAQGYPYTMTVGCGSISEIENGFRFIQRGRSYWYVTGGTVDYTTN